MVKPGVKARDVYAFVKSALDEDPVSEGSFWHHAGHGIGIHGHEAPRIIPGSRDVFEVGGAAYQERIVRFLDENSERGA